MLKKEAGMIYAGLNDSESSIFRLEVITNDAYDVVQYKFIHINSTMLVVQVNPKH